MKDRRYSAWFAAIVASIVLVVGAAAWTLFDVCVDRSGWVKQKNDYYYCDSHGRKISGWRVVDGYTFYFGSDKKMVTGWQDVDGEHRHFGENGTLSVGWRNLDDGRYYFASNGVALQGWQDINGSRYYFDNRGILQIGWRELDGKRYYFQEDGSLAYGWKEIDGERYYFIDDGTPMTGPAVMDTGSYYFLDNGMMHVGWLDRKDGRYYYDQNGKMVIGWAEISDKRFFFDRRGIMATGWLTLDEYSYYLCPDGSAAVGPAVIDGMKYYFSPRGVMVILVNKDNPIPKYYKYDLVTFVDWFQVQRVASEPLRRMLDDCNAAGNECQINSTYRSREDQVKILETRTEEYMVHSNMSYATAYAEALKTVARPDTSEHQLGLSMDLVGEDAHQWLSEHCWEYGFILRYEESKKDITGIINEPWHFRYVGLEVSMDMKDSGLCLEEYLGAA